MLISSPLSPSYMVAVSRLGTDCNKDTVWVMDSDDVVIDASPDRQARRVVLAQRLEHPDEAVAELPGVFLVDCWPDHECQDKSRPAWLIAASRTAGSSIMVPMTIVWFSCATSSVGV